LIACCEPSFLSSLLCIDDRVFKRITIQGAQGIQNVFSQSIPFRFFHSGATSPVVGKYASFARTNLSSLGLALDQNGEDEICLPPTRPSHVLVS
jgi:hypothetical protein